MTQHDICRTSPGGIPYRVRPDGSTLINAPRIHDEPYTVRLLVKLSPGYVAVAIHLHASEGSLVDHEWKRMRSQP